MLPSSTPPVVSLCFQVELGEAESFLLPSAFLGSIGVEREMTSHGHADEAMAALSFAGADGGPGEKMEGNRTEESSSSKFSVKSLLWHGGSVYDAWFSCASNQVKPGIPRNPDRRMLSRRSVLGSTEILRSLSVFGSILEKLTEHHTILEW